MSSKSDYVPSWKQGVKPKPGRRKPSTKPKSNSSQDPVVKKPKTTAQPKSDSSKPKSKDSSTISASPSIQEKPKTKTKVGGRSGKYGVAKSKSQSKSQSKPVRKPSTVKVTKSKSKSRYGGAPGKFGGVPKAKSPKSSPKSTPKSSTKAVSPIAKSKSIPKDTVSRNKVHAARSNFSKPSPAKSKSFKKVQSSSITPTPKKSSSDISSKSASKTSKKPTPVRKVKKKFDSRKANSDTGFRSKLEKNKPESGVDKSSIKTQKGDVSQRLKGIIVPGRSPFGGSKTSSSRRPRGRHISDSDEPRKVAGPSSSNSNVERNVKTNRKEMGRRLTVFLESGQGHLLMGGDMDNPEHRELAEQRGRKKLTPEEKAARKAREKSEFAAKARKVTGPSGKRAPSRRGGRRRQQNAGHSGGRRGLAKSSSRTEPRAKFTLSSTRKTSFKPEPEDEPEDDQFSEDEPEPEPEEDDAFSEDEPEPEPEEDDAFSEDEPEPEPEEDEPEPNDQDDSDAEFEPDPEDINYRDSLYSEMAAADADDMDEEWGEWDEDGGW